MKKLVHLFPLMSAVIILPACEPGGYAAGTRRYRDLRAVMGIADISTSAPHHLIRVVALIREH